jgi:tetratricopeptide (TPR) repeat protein
MKIQNCQIRLSFAAFLLLLGFAYWPGVTGGFIFDDAFNLKNIGAFGPVDNWKTFLLYITSGNADPTGRPISMLSFLWDATDWPAEAEHFKITNILIHLANAALLFRVVQIVETKLGIDAKAGLATAALTATIWAAHPLFVSTTLYVIQRHAMLPLTFTLLAWLCWSSVENSISSNRSKSKIITSVLGFLIFTLCAGLSKANGFLAPLLIFSSFLLLDPTNKVPKKIINTRILFLGIPSVIILLYLLLQMRYGLDQSYGRDFTLGERLLTQPRILIIYLTELFLPGVSNKGFYFGDTIQVSRSIAEPLSTLWSILIIMMAIVFLFLGRKKYPRTCIAISWFLAGHLLESSTIMLELYFEHRNYLPSVFLFLPIAHWLIKGQLLGVFRKALVFLMPILLISITYNKAIIWGSPELQAQLWKESNSASYRNLLNAATKAESPQDLTSTTIRINALIQKNPNSINLYLGLIGAECKLNGSSATTWANAYKAAESDNEFNVGIIDWLSHAIRVSANGDCPQLDSIKVSQLLESFSKNDSIRTEGSTESVIYHLKGYHSALSGDYQHALVNYNKAIDVNPDPDFVLTQAALLGNIGQEQLALQHIQHYKMAVHRRQNTYDGMQWLHNKLLIYFGYHESELLRLEKMLSESNHSNID